MRFNRGLASRLKYNQTGDTILAVMLSIAAITLVIVFAFSLINSSLNISRQARYRSQVVRLLESQAETLKSIVINGSTEDKNKIYTYIEEASAPHVGYFCFNHDSEIVQIKDPNEANSKLGDQPPDTNEDFSMPTSDKCETIIIGQQIDLKIRISYYKYGKDYTYIVNDPNRPPEQNLFVIEGWWNDGDGCTPPAKEGQAQGCAYYVIALRLHPLTA